MSSAAGLNVRRVSSHVVDVPSIRPHRFAGLEIKHQSYLVVRIETEDGLIGVGEGVSPGGPWWSGEGIESQRAMIEHHFAPLLLELDEVKLPDVVQQLDAIAYANDFAKAALEMALFDALGRRLDLPVSMLLGAGPCRRRLPVRWALSAAEPEEVAAEARDRLEMGHPALKLKMGAHDPAADVERVASIIDAVGRDVDYLVDPNGTWEYRTARWVVDELAGMGVSTVEQPVRRTDLEGLRDLTTRARKIVIMADESVCRPVDALRASQMRACDAVAVKVGKAGGLLRGYAVGTIAAVAGFACYGGTALESSIGTAASAHLFSALPELSLDCELVGPLLLTDDLVVDPIQYEDGTVVVPTGPGLGVDVDWDKVREYERG